MYKLLLIEDNEGLREQMKWALADDYQIMEADSLESAINICEKDNISLVCLDMGLENKSERGLDIIDALLTINRHIQIIVMTSNTSSTLGPDAINKGAIDYLSKPVDVDELKILLARASRLFDLEKSSEDCGVGNWDDESNILLIGKSEPMREIFNHIKRLSKTDVNVLITGQSGTGKELCARAIHLDSTRSNEAFVPINCGAIPESLMESELFGYIKGAFTGATTNKMGLIESANKGTLFLDEIGDMPIHLQVKLLRFLDDQSVQRIGDTKLKNVDVRVIAATNKNNLGDENNVVMRTDLFYRLSEFEIKLPPLKERGEDVLMIAQKKVEQNRKKFNSPKLKISPQAEDELLAYDWPGNIRELENRLNRASITCRSQTIRPEDLQLSPTAKLNSLTLKEARYQFERDYIMNSLIQAKWNISVAAKKADITRPTFYELMKKSDIAAKKESQSD